MEISRIYNTPEKATPRIIPTTPPTILAANPIDHNFSFFCLPITARITPAPPKKGGKNKTAMPPRTIAITE